MRSPAQQTPLVTVDVQWELIMNSPGLKRKLGSGSPNLTLDLSRMTPDADVPRIQSPGGGQSKNDCPLLVFRSPNIRLCLPLDASRLGKQRPPPQPFDRRL